MQQLPLILGLLAGIIAAIYASCLIARINKLPAGNERMQEIAGAIQEGAMARGSTFCANSTEESPANPMNRMMAAAPEVKMYFDA